MTTPAYIGATAGQPSLANQVNQFLGTHPASFIYTGVSLGGSPTLGSGGVNSNGLYVGQEMTPGTTQAVGRMVLTASVTGTPGPLTVTLQTNNAGAPSGTVLASTVVPYNYFPAAAGQVSIPLPITLTASTAYWLVFNAVGDASDFYTLDKSNATSGVSTSTNGTSWTGQTYGIYYVRWDQSVVTPLLHTWEDSGARWTYYTSASNQTLTGAQEYTVAQGTNNFVWSSRTYTTTNMNVVNIT